MKAGSMRRVLQHLRQAAVRPGDGERTDGQLLELFLARRDEAAFEALVRRHGPMVLGVCRRILKNTHDADDAFQATFLVLVRKGRSVVPRERVGNWLYGVAYRTALEARRAMAKRRNREQQAGGPAAAPADTAATDWQALLDQELNRLPEKYRLPVVLCLLEGRTRKEVARQLGWPEGTLSSRLATARRLLAGRLRRRGLGPAGVVGAAVLAEHTAPAAVPNALVAATVAAARTIAAGGVVSAPVAALTEGVLKAMLLTRLKIVTTGLLALVLVGLTAGAGAYYAWAGADGPAEPLLKPPTPNPQPPSSPKDAPKPALRLPAGNMPLPVLASLDAPGRIKLRFYGTKYRLEQWEQPDGQKLNYYAPVTQIITQVYPVTEVRVYNTQGKQIDSGAVPGLLKTQVLALVFPHGQPLDPLLLSLFKKGTLLFALPEPKSPPAPASPPAAPPARELPGTPVLPPPSAPEWGDAVAPAVITPAPLEAPQTPKKPGDETAALKREVERLHRENQRLLRILQRSDDQLTVIRYRAFQLPFALDAEQRDTVQKLNLFVSTNRGETWNLADQQGNPNQGYFAFTAPKDGPYWFAIQTIRKDGTAFPEELTALQPMQKVLVKTEDQGQ